jgi:hypothetical protein
VCALRPRQFVRKSTVRSRGDAGSDLPASSIILPSILRWAARIFVVVLAILLLFALSYVALIAEAWLTDSSTPLPDPITGRSDFSRLEHLTPAATIIPDSNPTIATKQLQDLVLKNGITTWQAHDCRFTSLHGRPHAAGWQSLYRHAVRCVPPDRSRHYS